MKKMLNNSRKVIFSILVVSVIAMVPLAFATTTFNTSFDVSGQDDTATGIAFNTDGTRMYMVGLNNDNVNQYVLSSGFDLSTATTEGLVTFNVLDQDNFPKGIAFNTDGTRMYMVGSISDNVNQYVLSSGFDLSTATTEGLVTFDVSGQDDEADDIAFNTDGTRMYVVGKGNDNVYEYVLSSGFDLSTATTEGVVTFDVSGESGNPEGLEFSADGTRMYVLDALDNNVYEYVLSSGFDLSTATTVGVETFDVSGQDSITTSIAFNTDGARMYVVGIDNDNVYEYVLTTSFEINGTPATTSSGSSNPSSKGYLTTPTIGLDYNGMRIIDNGFSYNGNAVDVIDFHTLFPLISAQVGQTNTVTVKVSDDQGITGLRLVQFGLGVPELDSPLNNAEVIIEIWFETGGENIEEIKIVDKNNLIEDSSIDVSTMLVDCRADSTDQCTAITMKHKYREAPIYNIILVEVMDQYRNLQASTFNDGVEVLGESMNPADTLKTHVPSFNYPQERGLVELTNIDRAEKLWIDPYGYVWQGDESKMVLVSIIPVNLADDDAKSVFFGYNNRINSHFADYKQEQLDKAIILFDSSLIQGDDLSNYVGETVIFVSRDDTILKQSLIDEANRAELILAELFSQIHYGSIYDTVESIEIILDSPENIDMKELSQIEISKALETFEMYGNIYN